MTTLGKQAVSCMVGEIVGDCGICYNLGQQAVGCTLESGVGTTLGARGTVQTVWI